MAATKEIGNYWFGDAHVMLFMDPKDETAATDSLVIKVNGTAQDILRKLWCGHHFCTVVTSVGTLSLPSCATTSPPKPTWTANARYTDPKAASRASNRRVRHRP